MVERVYARSGKDQRDTDGNDESVVLPATLANPIALLASHFGDGDDHARRDQQRAKWREEAERDEQPAKELAAARQRSIEAPRAHAHAFLVSLGRRREARAAEPAKELLRAVADK